MLLRIEICLLAAWIGCALLPISRWRWIFRAWRRLGEFSSHRALAILLVTLLGAAGSAFRSLAVSWPEPRVHDEFSYLLGSDTFTHGRLNNPTHPLWVHFETFHVNWTPTYCSIYPPGQAAFLAVGQVIGHPLIGVWISFGVACGAVCWMLQAWLPPRWALAGSLLALVRLGFIGEAGGTPGYWSQSYWGGAVAMFGGALVFGALGRLVNGIRNPSAPARWTDLVALALVMGLGAVTLANSRPLEGLVLCLLAGALLIYEVSRHATWKCWLAFGAYFVLPEVAILAAAAVAMAYYNARLTGDPLLMPYQQNGQRYAMVPLFIWQPLGPEPIYHHTTIRNYHVGWAVPAYERLRSPLGYTLAMASRVRLLFTFYLGPLLWLSILSLSWAIRNPRVRAGAIILGSFLCVFLTTTWFQPHYAAPAACLIYLVVTQCLRQLRLFTWHGRALGTSLAATLPAALVCSLLASCLLAATADQGVWFLRRAQILRELEKKSGQQLVLVRYRFDHDPHEEWVFNAADLDAAKVVWARDMGELWNQELIDSLRRGQVWLVEPDRQPVLLTPYPSPASF
jgi:hypothetical protein